MDILSAIAMGLFIALLIAVALSFGVAIFIFLAVVASLTVLLMWTQHAWARWRFVKQAQQREKPPANARIIEVDYEEIPKK